MTYCPLCDPEKSGIGCIAVPCVHCRPADGTPAYLIAMGDNDALLEQDLIAGEFRAGTGK